MADQTLVNITVEGRAVSVAAGTSILEAAKLAGVLIPHYCYHPGLPVAGVCRMCLVEVEKAPKLAPACATSVVEGQVVHVHSDKAREARKGVLEFLLINHPLDCPICDQSGQCELQDYTFQEGRKDSRYQEPKRFNPVEDFGGDVVYVTNRCILCTRCVRFMDEVVQEPVLNVSERGDRAVIGKFAGADLTNVWAGNVIELCPVGALLSKDILNKVRAWEVDRSASVCPNCAQGCNAIFETRDNVMVAMKPRPNADVNQYYLCDYGRLNYRWLNRQDRVELPQIRQRGRIVTAEWEVAVRAAAEVLKGRRAYVLASPMLSNETLFLLSSLVKVSGGAGGFLVEQGPEVPLPGVSDLALRRDRGANVRGAELLGFHRTGAQLDGLGAGDVLVVADEELLGLSPRVAAQLAARAGAVIVLGTVLPAWASDAAVVLPIANMAEDEGTFTNVQGRVQRFLQAKAAPGLARPAWYVLSDLLAEMGERTNHFLASEVFAALAAAHPEFAGLSYDSLGLRGGSVASAQAVPAGTA